MSLPHFFLAKPLQCTGEVASGELDQEQREHWRSLRLKTGERIVVVDSPDHGLELELTNLPGPYDGIFSGHIRGQLIGRCEQQLTLVQGISAADRMDQTIRQCTELGLVRIIPLLSQRSSVRLDAQQAASKLQRWQRVARSAAEQSCRLSLPNIEAPCNLDSALRSLAGYDGLIVAWEEAGGQPLGAVVRQLAAKVFANPRLALFIGPEGGFAASEVQAMLAAGAVQVSLGPTILRTETAAVVASTIALYHLGGLGAPDA